MSGAKEIPRLAREQAECALQTRRSLSGSGTSPRRGGERDAEKALSWLLKAAEQSDTDAQYNLGTGA